MCDIADLKMRSEELHQKQAVGTDSDGQKALSPQR